MNVWICDPSVGTKLRALASQPTDRARDFRGTSVVEFASRNTRISNRPTNRPPESVDPACQPFGPTALSSEYRNGSGVCQEVVTDCPPPWTVAVPRPSGSADHHAPYYTVPPPTPNPTNDPI